MQERFETNRSKSYGKKRFGLNLETASYVALVCRNLLDVLIDVNASRGSMKARGRSRKPGTVVSRNVKI
jgi:hypothetical protein